MRQHIDTAPVWEAYRQDCECPVCVLAARVEENNVGYFLGESVMEPDQRIEVNGKGFCPRHFKKLYEAGNRLGIGLMTHTYLKETMRRMEKDIQALNEAADAEAGKPLLKRIAGKKGAGMAESVDALKAYTDTCVLCERLDDNMERYIYTILYMYRHEKEFPELVKNSKGLCLKHFREVLVAASKHLTGETLSEFVHTVTANETENLSRLEKEIEWFTLKFDYRNDDKPWGNSRDAVKRTINKLRGDIIEK